MRELVLGEGIRYNYSFSWARQCAEVGRGWNRREWTLAKCLRGGAGVTYFSLYVYIQEGRQAVNRLSGIRARHGVWAKILEKFRFENLTE